MNILFCASEAAPFAASGGLGDVAGSLPRAIRNRKVACRVVMPLYGDMKQEYREKLTYITNFTVPVGWRNQYCGLFELTHNGVKYYFLDNEYYFKRTGLYGFYDDGERFAFFSRAILEMLFHVDFVPDVIHANDWQTALVPVYLNLYYRHLEQYRSIKTVFTIHNIQYQGKYGMEILEDTLAIGRQDAHLVEYDGCVNFMKGAIECADKVTTVSPSYAGEILDPWYSHGLDDLLRQKQYKLCGILNGIDVKSYDPATDPNLAANFDANSFAENKPKCKKELQEIFGLHDWPVPVVAMVTRLVGHKGVEHRQQRPAAGGTGLGRSGLRELFQRTGGPQSGRSGREDCICALAGPQNIRRRGYVPYAVKIRALRLVPDGGAALRHNPHRARDGRPAGFYPRFRRRLGQRLHIPQLQCPRHAECGAARKSGV